MSNLPKAKPGQLNKERCRTNSFKYTGVEALQQKLLNHLLITHGPRLRNHCIVRISQLAIVYIAIVCQHFHTYYTGKIFVSHVVTSL